MSDSAIILIPELPDYVPSKDARLTAVALIQILSPKADSIEEELTDEIRFIDCGSNFEGISCPACRNGIEMDWWRNEMDRESDGGFRVRPLALPCCGAFASLDLLVYNWPQGFARYSIAALNPQTPDLTPNDLSRFETALGCKVRKILRHL